MAKAKKSSSKAPKNFSAVAGAKQNPKLATQQRKALRAHYFARYRVR
jgi:hypothetical protein